MTDEVKLILFYLQTLHYRDDLENNLYTNLRKFSESDIISELDIKSIFKQKVHPELIKNVTDILADFKVFTKQYGGYGIDKQQLEVFIKMASAAKASRTYNWPDVRSKPFLYVSPPNIITSELSEEIDDISNLLTSLVSSATKTVSIVSPFTNKAGLNSVLAPLKSCKNLPSNSIYLTADTLDQEMIYKQIIKLIPSKMLEHLRIYFCTSEEMDGDYLPHAKLLIVDSVRGYLGSANFTRQGLTSRFEVGVELDEQQSKSVEKLLLMLVEKGVFALYSPR